MRAAQLHHTQIAKPEDLTPKDTVSPISAAGMHTNCGAANESPHVCAAGRFAYVAGTWGVQGGNAASIDYSTPISKPRRLFDQILQDPSEVL